MIRLEPTQRFCQKCQFKCESAISFEDISEFVYNSLRSLEGTNEQYKSDSELGAINIKILKNQNLIEVFAPFTYPNNSIPALWRQIQEREHDGYNNLSTQQVYYWWSIESRKIYQRNSDSLKSAHLLLTLNEFKQEIIIYITIPTVYNVFNFQYLNLSFYYNSLETNEKDFLLESDAEKEAPDNVLNHLFDILD
ncbi:2420_t:CDS:2 [Cetraspora pellucida]|uniref:2420_t:CDS:1 n=1 Tax=Cetraspora pellucida TaxID=1433469 RepID=A0A9N9IE11_9GLOM|nr:2420_t:CDS:2 [Cetraspora pellucida]